MLNVLVERTVGVDHLCVAAQSLPAVRLQHPSWPPLVLIPDDGRTVAPTCEVDHLGHGWSSLVRALDSPAAGSLMVSKHKASPALQPYIHSCSVVEANSVSLVISLVQDGHSSLFKHFWQRVCGVAFDGALRKRFIR